MVVRKAKERSFASVAREAAKFARARLFMMPEHKVKGREAAILMGLYRAYMREALATV